jgi:DNA repair protein RadA/Sms
MLLAVLHRHAGIPLHDQDVFVNVVGGVRVTETAADTALILSALSSFRDKALNNDIVTFGEIGLAGEIRPVPNGLERLREAAKHGFKRAIIPLANKPGKNDIQKDDLLKKMEIIGVSRIDELLSFCQQE